MEESRMDKIKNWFSSKKESVVKFCADHPDVVLTVIGGFASLAGGCIKLYCSKTEYEDYVYTVTTDDEIYKIPAKPVKSCTMESYSRKPEEEEKE